MDKKEYTLTPAEWEIMRVIWTAEETTSTEISAIVNEEMNWKPATTKTLIGRLVKKGFLSTTRDGKRFIYQPLITENECLDAASSELLSRVCKKKKGSILGRWLQETEISQTDLLDIEQIIHQKKESAADVIPCACLQGQCTCQPYMNVSR